jgi:hypothetical protein
MTLPREESIGNYECYLRNRPFSNPVAIIDNQLHLYYACEEKETGTTTSFEVTVPFTPDMIDSIQSQLAEAIRRENSL